VLTINDVPVNGGFEGTIDGFEGLFVSGPAGVLRQRLAERKGDGIETHYVPGILPRR
jgi:hypothetical protein